MYDVTIKTLPAMAVVALRHVGPYDTIGEAFQRLMAWGRERGLVGPETRRFAIYHDDPAAVPAERLRSDASFAAPAGFVPEGDFRLETIAGGRHAVLIHKGPYADLDRPYRWLYRTWLPASGEAPAERPPFDESLNNPTSLPPSDWLTAIHLPLKG